MAKPIKDTPVLRGRDAAVFIKKMEEVIPISKQEKDKQKEVYEQFKKIANFEL